MLPLVTPNSIQVLISEICINSHMNIKIFEMQVLSSSLFSRCCSQLLRLFLISIAPMHISSNFLSSSFRLWMLYELSPSLSSSDNKLRAIV